MAKHFTIALLLTVTLVSCQKDKPIVPILTSTTQDSTTNYTPMTTGSYWVYDWYVVDSSGNATLYNKRDSIYIIGDTVIGSHTYAVQEWTWFGGSLHRQFLRDSIGYLINETGRIFYSATNYTDTLYLWNSFSGETTGYLKMNDINEMVTVPAGTFTTSNAEFIVVNNVGTWPCLGTLDIHDNQYADNIGKVRATFQNVSDSACRVYEQRLVSYYIN